LGSFGALLTNIHFDFDKDCITLVVSMRRKIIITTLAFFYLLLASGVTVNIHYCMGRLASMQLAHEGNHEEDACGKCGMDKKKNACCHDEFKILKITSEHKIFTAELVKVPIDSNDWLTLSDDFHPSIQGVSSLPSSTYHSPPPLLLNKRYRTNRVFLI
jgi:hypothetical protein